MKKYGIRITEYDNTPGFRSQDVTVKWFTDEAERSKHYNDLTKPRKPDLRDMMICNDDIACRYEKIEE